MIRTRDFLLFLISVAFLIVAIGVEFVRNIKTETLTNSTPTFITVTNSPESFSAEVIASPDTRSSRLESIRKILAEQDSVISAPAPIEPVEEVGPTTTSGNDDLSEPMIGAVLLCKNYHPTFISWTTDKIQIEEREGMRVFFTDTNISASGTTTDALVGEVVHAVLPIRSLPLSKPNCISGEVVGIATDGSLIKNNEQKVYGVFGESTLVGYALDGFPIYGLSSDRKTDVCGGVIVDGSYRYYLNKERVGVLGCFSGIPVTL